MYVKKFNVRDKNEYNGKKCDYEEICLELSKNLETDFMEEKIFEITEKNILNNREVLLS